MTHTAIPARFWRQLFYPESIALIGASATPGSWGHGIMRHLVNTTAKVYPINPRAKEIMGRPVYPDLLDIKEPIELAVIAVSALQVPETLRQCIQKGIKAAVVIAGGFAEAGDDGKALEQEILDIARAGGIHFIGPNSMGHMNTAIKLSTLAWTGEMPPGQVALISQSGNVGHRIMHTGLKAGFGFSKGISTGNEASLRLEDYLEYLAGDDETKVITAYIEGLREARRFYELAKTITPRKPVVVVKSGGTGQAASAAHSHTGALAGSDAVYSAAFKQAGVIRAADDDELCDVVAALLAQPLPRGKRVGILTVGGGLGVMAAESVERAGLEVAALEAATIATLDKHLPPRWSHANPVDMAGVPATEIGKVYPAVQAVLADKNIDAVLFQAPLGLSPRHLKRMFGEAGAAAFIEDENRQLADVRRWVNAAGKPLLLVTPSVEFASEPEAAASLHCHGIPIYSSPRRAAVVLQHLAGYRDYLDAAGK